MNDDEFLTTYLKCDVELDLSAPNIQTINNLAASTLRMLAERIERNEFEDGFTEAKDNTGKTVGTIYVDYSEGNDRPL